MSARGTLFLIVGASGAGKDTLIAAARSRLGQTGRYSFPRRTITRLHQAGGEDHVETTVEEFERLERDGAFATSWRAHGHAYGIPASMAMELAGGRNVVINVSREIVPDARRRFAPVHVIEVTAPADLRTARLRSRGREKDDAIAPRVARLAAVEPDDIVANDGELERAVAAFLAALTKVEKEAPGP